ncbi:MAG TPA: hypothetical protein VLT86_20160 [Vicinamibacterales bacterium]|nr:hypothetical protein [Vicinamibacterales bacterium]
MAPLRNSRSFPIEEFDRRFARADRIVRTWWVAVFITLVLASWLTHGGLV